MSEQGDIVFTLKPTDSEVPDLIRRYQGELDADCLAAGIRIRNGDFSKENLRAIYRWKMQSYSYLGQERKYFDKNSDESVANVLQAAIDAIDKHGDTERAFRELQSLKGIGLPVASAILTAVFPERFTVIDVMALRALGVPEGTPLSVPLYERYLTFCWQHANRLGISLRDMDRALWQWGSDHPSKKGHAP
jgi:hypothetical protein